MKCISFLAVTVILFIAACNKDNNDNTRVNSTDAYFVRQASYSNYDEINAGTIAAIKGIQTLLKCLGA